MARAEWIKLRSVRSTVRVLAASAVTIAGTGLLLTMITRGHLAAGGRPQMHIDPVRISLFGMYLAQLTVGLLGVLLVTGEYATGLYLTLVGLLGIALGFMIRRDSTVK